MNLLQNVLAEAGVLQSSEDDINLSMKSVLSTDVQDVLKKADEEAMMDAARFVLETEDGKFVKLYVKKELEQQVQDELADALGKENDIEKVLSSLKEKDAILKVEYPNETEEQPEDEVQDDELSDLMSYVNGKFKEATSAPQQVQEQVDLKQASQNDFITLDSLKHQLSNANQRLILDLVVELGVPIVSVAKNWGILKESLKEFEHHSRTNTPFKKYAAKLLDALKGTAVQPKAVVQEDVAAELRLHDVVMKKIVSLLSYMGVQDDVLTYRKTMTRENLNRVAKKIRADFSAYQLFNFILRGFNIEILTEMHALERLDEALVTQNRLVNLVLQCCTRMGFPESVIDAYSSAVKREITKAENIKKMQDMMPELRRVAQLLGVNPNDPYEQNK